MDKFLEFVVNKVFSFGTLLCLLCAAFVYFYFVFQLANQSEISRENTRQLTEACYSQGMVLVDTDAGQRCVDPRTLVKVK